MALKSTWALAPEGRLSGLSLVLRDISAASSAVPFQNPLSCARVFHAIALSAPSSAAAIAAGRSVSPFYSL
jgi:hypothetical protein